MLKLDTNSQNPPASVRMLLQYRVIYWGVRLAAAVSVGVFLFILLAFPPEQKLISATLTVSIVIYFLALQFWLLPRVRTPAGVDMFSAAFLFAPTVAGAMKPFYEPGQDTAAMALGVTVFASMCFVSHKIFSVWAIFTLGLFGSCVYFVGQGLTTEHWISFLFLAPVLAFINRIVVQGNYDFLLEKTQHEGRLSSELAVTRRFQEQSKHDLKEQSSQLTSILSHAPIILCVMDPNGVYTQSRGLGLEKLGLQENELVGKQFCELYCDNPNMIAAFKKAQAGESANVRVSVADGLTHEIQYSPIFDQQSELTAVVGVGVDLSESVLAESQRVDLEFQLYQAQKMESLGVLASGVAHDFNNYLSGIIVFCDALNLEANNQKSSENQEVVREIRKIAENAAGICEQMLMFAGKSTHDKRPVDLNSIVAENEKFLGAVVTKNVELKLELSQKPLPILANKLLIQQAIVNLVKNSSDALEGQPDGRVVIKTELIHGLPASDKIAIQVGEFPADSANSLVRLTVKDNGPGIDKEKVSRIFEPYYSAKDTGHGFGLAITSGIMQHHDGVISCRTGSDGTRMELVFEFENSWMPSEGVALIDELSSDNRRKILLVDDERSIVRSVKLAFDTLGYDVSTAESAKEAIAIIEDHDPFDCLIIDYTMPQMNGLDLLRLLRKRGVTSPAIFCSGYLELPEYEDAVPDATLRKPYSIATLHKTVEQLCLAVEESVIN